MPRINLLHFNEDDLVYRESFRNQERIRQGWYFRDYTEGIKIDDTHYWKYIKRLLRNSIGKSFDTVFSNFCHIAPIIYQNDFLDEFRFVGRRWYIPDYYVDVNGLIQEAEHVIKERIERREQRKKPYIRRSHDWKGGYVNKTTGAVLTKEWHWYYSHQELRENYEWKMVSGSEWKVQKGSREDKRYYYEDKTKYRAKNKAERKARKEKRYSFKTATEIQAKMLLEKTRLENDNNILRHGFDKDSFKGEHYHGRKNKKTKV